MMLYITLLYVKLKLWPPRRLLHSTYQAHLVSLTVSRTLCFATSMVPSGTVVVSHEDTGLPPRAPPLSLYHGLWSFVKVGNALHLLMNLPPCTHGPAKCLGYPLMDQPPGCRPLHLFLHGDAPIIDHNRTKNPMSSQQVVPKHIGKQERKSWLSWQDPETQ